MKKSNKLTLYILVAMLLGAILGYIINKNYDAVYIEKFSKNIIQTYKTRNKDVNYLLEEANIEHQIYETCFLLARKNKIIDYWVNIWGESSNYKDTTLIEHLIIK